MLYYHPGDTVCTFSQSEAERYQVLTKTYTSAVTFSAAEKNITKASAVKSYAAEKKIQRAPPAVEILKPIQPPENEGLSIRKTISVRKYKALRSAGGLRHPLRSIRKEKYITLCETDKGP